MDIMTQIETQSKQAECLQCTKEYDTFSFHPQQRDLNANHIIKLTKSMKERGFISTCPIVVNADFQILDGQHRFQAAKNLGLPIYYIVDYRLNVDDVREMAQTVSKWSFDDYVTSQISQSNDNYKRLRMLQTLSGLNWDAFMCGCFTNFKASRVEIIAGKLVLTERKETEIREFLGKFELFKEPFPAGWHHRYFVTACAQVFSHPKYNHEQMKARLDYQSTRMVKCVDVYSYVKMIEAIYNYRSHAANMVDFNYGRSAR